MIDIVKMFDELRASVKATEGKQASDKEISRILVASLSIAECVVLDLRRIADAAERPKNVMMNNQAGSAGKIGS